MITLGNFTRKRAAGSAILVVSLISLSVSSCGKDSKEKAAEHPPVQISETCASPLSSKASTSLEKVSGHKRFIDPGPRMVKPVANRLTQEYRTDKAKSEKKEVPTCILYFPEEYSDESSQFPGSLNFQFGWIDSKDYVNFTVGDRKESSVADITYPTGYWAGAHDHSAGLVFPCIPKGESERKDRALLSYFSVPEIDIAPSYRKSLDYQTDKMRVLNSFARYFAKEMKCTNDTLLANDADLAPIGDPQLP